MLPSDLNTFMDDWRDDQTNVFKYSRPLVPDEYIAIRRDSGVFTSTPGVSTYTLNPMDEVLIRKMLSTDELTYRCFYYSGLNVKDLKTGGCNCASWILQDNQYLHDQGCPCYKERYK